METPTLDRDETTTAHNHRSDKVFRKGLGVVTREVTAPADASSEQDDSSIATAAIPARGTE